MSVRHKTVGVITYATTRQEAMSAGVGLASLFLLMAKHAMVRRLSFVPSNIIPFAVLIQFQSGSLLLFTEPPAVPQNVRVSNVGQRSATVSWDPPSNTFPNSLTAVSAYRVSASQDAFQQGNRVATKSKQSRTHQFTNLEEYTTYSFSVAASNTFGEGVVSEPKEATTLQAGLFLAA